MAGEYSREFSAKAFNGQSRLIELGFRQGGPAGYGWSFCALQAVMDGAHQQRSQSRLAWARSSPAPAVGREIDGVEAGGHLPVCADRDRRLVRNDKAALAAIECMPPEEWDGLQQRRLRNLFLEVGRTAQ